MPDTNLPKVYVASYWGTAWLSKIIEFFTKGPSHIALIHQSPEFDRWLQLGSEAGGWIYLPLDTESLYEVYEVPVDLWKGLRANAKFLGIPYDFGGLLGMAPVMVAWQIFKKKIKNPLNSLKAWFCSEAAAVVLKDSGMPLELGPGETDPKRLIDEIKAHGAVKVDKKVLLG